MPSGGNAGINAITAALKIYDATLNTNIILTTTPLKLILTVSNLVEIITNIRSSTGITIAKDSVLATLPAILRPTSRLFLPVGYYDSNPDSYSTTWVYIRPNGEICTLEQLNTDGAGYIYFYLNGINYNISNKYYG